MMPSDTTVEPALGATPRETIVSRAEGRGALIPVLVHVATLARFKLDKILLARPPK